MQVRGFGMAEAGATLVSDPPGFALTPEDRDQTVRMPLSEMSLHASQRDGFEVTKWDYHPECPTAPQTCTFAVQEYSDVDVTWAPWVRVVSYEGTVRAEPGGLVCGHGECRWPLVGAAQFVAVPDSNWTLSGWEGDCAGAGTSSECDLDVTGPILVKPVFVHNG
jgi:hypothetical protein